MKSESFEYDGASTDAETREYLASLLDAADLALRAVDAVNDLASTRQKEAAGLYTSSDVSQALLTGIADTALGVALDMEMQHMLRPPLADGTEDTNLGAP